MPLHAVLRSVNAVLKKGTCRSEIAISPSLKYTLFRGLKEEEPERLTCKLDMRGGERGYTGLGGNPSLPGQSLIHHQDQIYQTSISMKFLRCN